MRDLRQPLLGLYTQGTPDRASVRPFAGKAKGNPVGTTLMCCGLNPREQWSAVRWQPTVNIAYERLEVASGAD